MDSPIGSAPVQALDLVMGLGKTTSQKASSPGDFDWLLGLFPQMASPDQETLAASPGQDATVNLLGQGQEVTLLLPLSLVEMLGLGGSLPTEENTDLVSTDGDDSAVTVQAEMFVSDDGTDQNLLLRLATEPESSELLSRTTLSEGQFKESILPMRLWTVEQRDGRIVADAELLTAAGKETSVRVTLEVAGSLNGIHNDSGLTALETGTDAVGQSSGKSPNLTRLLQELSVQKIIIEPLDSAVPTVSAAATAEAAGQTTPSARPTVASALDGILPQNAASLDAATPISPDSSGSDATASGDEQADESWTNQALTRPAQSEVSVIPAKGGHGVAATAAEVSGETAISSSTDSSGGENAPVRYLDLDARLEYLKHNPGQRIRIQMIPPQLGKMDLDIASYRGQVTVTLTVDSAAAKTAVEKSLTQLENRLTTAGIRVDQFQVTVSQSARQDLLSGQQQSGYGNLSQGGGNKSSWHDARRWAQYAPSQEDFQQVMVNCLA